MNTKNVLVPIANGSEEIEIVCIVDTLRRAGAQVTLASVEDSLQVVCSRSVKLEADISIKDCVNKSFDAVVLPGGMPGATRLRDCTELKEILLQQKECNRLFAAICAAPAVVLEHHGLLQGLTATCHPNFSKELTNQSKAGLRVVRDVSAAGRCITSQAPGTALEFALAIVEDLFGKEIAAAVSQPMLIYPS